MSSLNKVMLIGRLGQDPEIKVVSETLKVAEFSVATSDKYKDKSSGELKEVTEWHNVKVYNRLADIVEKYVKKGQLIFIEGKNQTRSWEDESGKKNYRTEVVGLSMTMLGGKRDNESAPYANEYKEKAASQNNEKPAAENTASSAAPQEDDDLPF